MSPSTVSRIDAATPDGRNRVVDLLRAAAIFVVVIGHWLMAAVYVDDTGTLARGDLLDIADWTHPLTWVLQVMPVFFLVGGYANALSWRSSRSKGTTYGGWLRARLRRLTLPVLPLMVFWAVGAPLASWAGMSADMLRIASMASLVPTWFLAAYVVVVSVAPLTLSLWERVGWWSVGVGLVLSAVVDWVSISSDQLLVGFVNYLFVWATVHQLGYAWLDGALAGTTRRLALGAVGLVGLVLLVQIGPYATSMVGLQTDQVNNAYPTRVTLAFLGLFQIGLVLTVEPVLARLVAGRRAWAGVVLVNMRIMTVYLWHLTALGMVITVSMLFGGPGLMIEPNTSQWWTSRPLWFATLGLVTLGLVLLLGRFEMAAPDDRPAPRAWLPVTAMVVTCAGLGVMADVGIAAEGTVRWYLPLVPVAASFLFGISRVPRVRRGGTPRPSGHRSATSAMAGPPPA